MSNLTTKTKKTTFFALPRELRDLVYELACEGVEVVTFKNKRTSSKIQGNLLHGDSKLRASKPDIAILRVCSQIRFEAQPIYYHLTTFTFTNPIDCAHWIKHYVPSDLQHKLSDVRIQDSLSKGQFDEMKERVAANESPASDFSLANATRGMGQEALSEVKKGLRWSGVWERLNKGALQVMVIDKEWNFVWTATPSRVELPSKTILASA